jgi:hypothetical protein
MKCASASLITVIASLVVLTANNFALPATSEAESESQHSAAQVPSAAKSAGMPGMGIMGLGTMSSGMMAQRMMGASPMVAPRMIGEPGGMLPGSTIDLQMLQMMMDDPKTRARMMEIQGRMMKEMGELMEQRGKELEQAK